MPPQAVPESEAEVHYPHNFLKTLIYLGPLPGAAFMLTGPVIYFTYSIEAAKSRAQSADVSEMLYGFGKNKVDNTIREHQRNLRRKLANISLAIINLIAAAIAIGQIIVRK